VGAVGNDKLYVRVIFDVPNPSTCPGGHGASVPRSVPSPPSGVVGELHKSPVGEGSRKLERPLPSKGGSADARETSVARRVVARKGDHRDRGKPGSRLERHGSPSREREREGVRAVHSGRCAGDTGNPMRQHRAAGKPAGAFGDEGLR
jgi:hypothetical protein